MRKQAKEVREWFKQHVADGGKSYLLDPQQAEIVADTHKNTLVTARAGSGKTRTIVAKAVYLMAHEGVRPDEIVIFAFNRKARAEINERLTKIAVQGQPLFSAPPKIATTFHAFAYKLLGGKTEMESKLIDERLALQIVERALKHYLYEDPKTAEKFESLQPQTVDERQRLISQAKQFIDRAEQQFFEDYRRLDRKVKTYKGDLRLKLELFNAVLGVYRRFLEQEGKLDFNQMMATASQKMTEPHSSPYLKNYRHIFIDEYQDFSLLFLKLVQNLRANCPDAHLLAVGDDWQAINRFAGSDVQYFQRFEKYFPEDWAKLSIPTNYRSGRKIVENANYFMGRALKDYQGCKTGNRKLKAHVHALDVTETGSALPDADDLPLLLQQYINTVQQIILSHPGKTVKILHRNNDLSFEDWSLSRFMKTVQKDLEIPEELLTFSTVHRSKGLEADIVILLEMDARKFPEPPRENNPFVVFGDTRKVIMADQYRLFYVALTRAKEELYLLSRSCRISKKDRGYNFLEFLNGDYLS